LTINYTLAFSQQLKLWQALKPFSDVKKQGKPLLAVLVAMLLSRLGGMSVYAMQQTGHLRDG
jgi:amino acid permease